MKKKTLFLIILGVVALFAIPIIISLNQAMNYIEELKSLNLPRPDSSYNLKSSKLVLRNVRTFQMDTISLSGITIINFWAPWCAPCIEEQPSLEEFAKNRNVMQFSFDSIGSLKKIINKLNWTIPAYALIDTTYFNKPLILPTTLVLKDSTVLKVIYGQRNWIDTSMTNYFETLN